MSLINKTFKAYFKFSAIWPVYNSETLNLNFWIFKIRPQLFTKKVICIKFWRASIKNNQTNTFFACAILKYKLISMLATTQSKGEQKRQGYCFGPMEINFMLTGWKILFYSYLIKMRKTLSNDPWIEGFDKWQSARGNLLVEKNSDLAATKVRNPYSQF